ncbi:MAG: DNA polymerase III subunit epsilon [Xanthobacteraceae bacterium]
MREIVLDTETTGLDPGQGHRLIEIGCVELFNRIPTGQAFHRYINPERDIPEEAFRVHGISFDMLKDKPLFHEVADELMEFLGDAPLVIHNAMFDLGFINAELARATRPLLDHARLIDTLLLARRKHPAGPNRLDDLCLRYRIDSSRRTKHGALLDAELLAEVYVELIGARQAALVLVENSEKLTMTPGQTTAMRSRPMPLTPRLTEQDRAAHRDFVGALGSGAIWKNYLPSTASQENTALPPAENSQ